MMAQSAGNVQSPLLFNLWNKVHRISTGRIFRFPPRAFLSKERNSLRQQARPRKFTHFKLETSVLHHHMARQDRLSRRLPPALSRHVRNVQCREQVLTDHNFAYRLALGRMWARVSLALASALHLFAGELEEKYNSSWHGATSPSVLHTSTFFSFFFWCSNRVSLIITTSQRIWEAQWAFSSRPPTVSGNVSTNWMMQSTDLFFHYYCWLSFYVVCM